ncbi:ribosomal protein S25, partial [Trypanosoma cruzi]
MTVFHSTPAVAFSSLFLPLLHAFLFPCAIRYFTVKVDLLLLFFSLSLTVFRRSPGRSIPRMPPKKNAKPTKPAPKKGKMENMNKGAKKAAKKWSKGRTREALQNAVVFDKETMDKLLSEVPKYKVITPSIISDR